MLRRLKEDVLSELPDKIESMESAELLPDQKKLYAAYLAKLREDTLKHLDKDTLRKKSYQNLGWFDSVTTGLLSPSLICGRL
ncbi:hypothetical protein GCM10020331_055980 [Ectobacillus funiculus]